jgi:two-component system sensor histidine kinase TtrS
MGDAGAGASSGENRTVPSKLVEIAAAGEVEALRRRVEELEQSLAELRQGSKQAAGQLRFQAQLLDSVRESLIATDLDGRVTYWGKGAESLYGYTAEEMTGRPITLIVAPEEAHEEIERMNEVRRCGAWRGQYVQRRKDGSSFWADTVIALVTDEHGLPCGSVGIDRDITQRIEAEERAQRLHDELAHAARVITMSEIAAGVSHELNQPLTVISSSARVCLECMRAGANASSLVARLETIAAAAERAGEIIHRHWSLVGKGEPRRARVGVNALVREILSLMESEARHHRAALELDLAESLPAVEVDGVQIQQVLLNLVRNACEAMCELPPGARRLTVATSAPAPCAVRVSVRDSGPGIAPDLLDEVFEPFHSTKSHGLGMGLAISRRIVEAHGGRLTAEPGGPGATLAFTLPAS